MKSRIRRSLYSTGLALALLIIGSGLVWAYGTCAFESASAGKLYSCYFSRINTIAEKRGVPAALEYVRFVVYPNNGYAMVHVLLHRVGDLAFYENANVAQMSSYLLPYQNLIQDRLLLGGFDGFIHGYVTEYMESQKDKIPATMKYLCGGGLQIPTVTTDPGLCYHMLGHALMHASGNELDTALGLCDTASTTVTREGCYYGTFMEDSFLYNAQYHEESSRPDSIGPSMKGVCDRFTGERETYCDMYVGESYLARHPDDTAGAFRECESLKQNQSNCVSRLGNILIASFAHNASDIKTMCDKYASPIYQRYCISSAQESLQAGLGIQSRLSFATYMDNLLHAFGLSVLALK